MKKSKNFKLTRKAATELICSVLPVPKSSIYGGELAPGASTYKVQSGALEITCTNDWRTDPEHILLTIADGPGGNCIHMLYHSETFERDFAAEEAYKEEIQQEKRQDWVYRIGKEEAHKLVDRYWGD